MQNYVWGILASLFILDIVKVNYEKSNQTPADQPIQDVITPDSQVTSGMKVKSEDGSEIKVEYEGLHKSGLNPTDVLKYYEEFRRNLSENYSNVEVVGQEYPVNILRKIIKYSLSALQMVIMFLLVGGQNARNYFSFIPPQYLDLIEQKKWVVGIATFFLVPQLQNMITSTGAFEVYVNGTLIHSKLKTGVVPILGDLEKMIIGLGFNLIPK